MTSGPRRPARATRPKVAAYYSEDAMVYPPNDVVAIGRERPKEAWAAMLADPS